MKQAYLFLQLFIIFIISPAFAQKQGNIWYFGDSAGISFNEPVPVVLLNSQIYAEEATAVQCNADGELLFYAGNRKLLNRNHEKIADIVSILQLPNY